VGWLVAFLVCGLWLGLWIWQRRRFSSDWRRLDNLLAEVAEGRDPYRVEFHDARRFDPLAEAFERLAMRQREAREELRLEAVNLRTILRSMDDGVMVVDSQHVIRFVNPAFRELFAVRVEAVGETVLRILRGAEFEKIVNSVLQTGEGLERDVSTNGGRQQRHFAVSAVPLRDTQGRPGVVMIFRDISQLRKLEDVRKEFVANVSHELRTPLSIFQGYLETLIDSPNLSAADAHPMLLVMNKHSRRLNALVEDLLILARLESRDEQLQLAPLEVARFVRESVADWSLRSAEKKIALTAETAADLPAIEADAFRLEQVMSNLIDNAIKYTEPGGSVTVRALAADESVEIRVEDTGLGIAPADVPRIFERFYRADKARSREHGGTGLGLSIVKHIVLAHGGTVRAESKHGKGTVVILHLPLKPPATSATTPPSA
jgi:two-component system phosphate regulon sensor histidine kinase PhoR